VRLFCFSASEKISWISPSERVDLIEHQLAHAVKEANGRIYNRTAHLPTRRVMMQTWANYLRIGAEVIQLRTTVK
jgi:predicted metallopeptidase